MAKPLSTQPFDDDLVEQYDLSSAPPSAWEKRRPRRRCSALPQTFWFYSTWVLLVTCIFFLLGYNAMFNRIIHGTYETGFNTDLDVARSAIKIHRVRFTGGLHYDENGTVVRNPLPKGAGAEWVGSPSPEIDAQWDFLTSPLTSNLVAAVDLSGKDAQMVQGKTRQRPTGEYITGLDIFHQLHCLDKIRRSLDPDHYHDPDGPEIQRLHTDHCLDYIRQSLMCTADMTPAYVVYSASADRWSPDFESEHTCRDFQAMVDWSRQRQHSGPGDGYLDHHHDSHDS